MLTKLAFGATIAAALFATAAAAQTVTTTTQTTTTRTTNSSSHVEEPQAKASTPQPLPFGPASVPFPGDASAQSAQSESPAMAPSAGAGTVMKEPNNPQANMRESRSYEQMLSSNPAYRERRIQQECGEIASADVKQQCIDSFGPAKAPASRKQM